MVSSGKFIAQRLTRAEEGTHSVAKFVRTGASSMHLQGRSRSEALHM
jgi:hypothetical protein